MNYFTKEVSERIRAMGLETSATDYFNPRVDEPIYGMMCRPKSLADAGIYWEVNNYKDDFGLPAYRLDDILQLMDKAGDKLGQMGICNNCGAESIKNCSCIDAEVDIDIEGWDLWHSYSLVDTFLEGGYKGASEYFLHITKEYDNKAIH